MRGGRTSSNGGVGGCGSGSCEGSERGSGSSGRFSKSINSGTSGCSRRSSRSRARGSSSTIVGWMQQNVVHGFHTLFVVGGWIEISDIRTFGRPHAIQNEKNKTKKRINNRLIIVGSVFV